MAENPTWVTIGGGDGIPDDVFDHLEAFVQEASAAARTPVQHAVRWLLDQPGIASVLVGVKYCDQLETLLD